MHENTNKQSKKGANTPKQKQAHKQRNKHTKNQPKHQRGPKHQNCTNIYVYIYIYIYKSSNIYKAYVDANNIPSGIPFLAAEAYMRHASMTKDGINAFYATNLDRPSAQSSEG